MFWFWIIIFVIVLYMFGPQILWHIKKFYTPLSGRINELKDVNDFLANYKFFEFDLRIDSDIGYVPCYIVSVRQMRLGNFPGDKKGIFIKRGIYTYIGGDLHKDKENLLRKFVWDHRNEINRKFDEREDYAERKIRNAKIEEENAEAERDFEKKIKNAK
ncbi:MAG: ATP synthase subunit B family protein [bacterium]